MTLKHHETDASRRDFLKAAAATAVAATATGTGAALLSGTRTPGASVQTTTFPVSQVAIPAGDNAAAEVFAQLVATRAENIRLQANLDALQRHLLAEQDNSPETLAERLRVELEAATHRVSLLSGLIALYEQLEAIDLGQLALDGLASVSAGIRDLLADVPSLAAGVEVGRQALDELEDHLPVLQSSRRWIDGQVEELQTYFGRIELLLRSALDATAPFVQLLNGWFQDILRWLPFGLGERAGAILEAIATLLVEIPHTTNGLVENVVRPLDKWLDGDADEVPLRQKLVRPMREQVLDLANRTAIQAEYLADTYRGSLAEPVTAAAGNQRVLTGLIAEYRRHHQI
jgi:hypothetical protein